MTSETINKLQWRLTPGYLKEGGSDLESTLIFFECSCTCINYKDFETKKIRRSFTCQFHPELLSDLRELVNVLNLLMQNLKKVMVFDYWSDCFIMECKNRGY